MTGRLESKRAVIAGVGPGMGSAIAVRFADEGAHVLLVARTEERLATLVETIRTRGGKADAVAADLADDKDVEKVLQTAQERLGGTPDILVNAVGAWRPGPVEKYDAEVIDSMLRLNLQTVMTTTPAFAMAMQAAGGGAIVNVGAVFGGVFPSTGQAVYNATKAGVRGYTESAAADLLKAGVRVNCVLPGGTDHDYEVDRDHRTMRLLGQDKMGKPEDVAAAVLFLAGDDASWITGASLVVDGGASVRRG